MGRLDPDHPRADLGRWFAQPPGRHVARAEGARVRAVLGCLFGYQVLQVGALGAEDLLGSARSPFRSRVDLGGEDGGDEPRVRGRADLLPIDSESTDIVVLAHVLEFEAHPPEALREAFRVLVPEGHLVLCGFNPWSLLGLARLAAWGRREGPWRGRFLTARRLREWLDVLGFAVLGVHGAFYGPALRGERLARAGARLDRHISTPLLAGTYVVVARKRVTTLTPVRPRWRPKARLAAVGLAGGTAARGRAALGDAG